MVDSRLFDAINAGNRAAALGDMPEQNIVRSMLGGAYDVGTLAEDVRTGKVDPLSDEGIGRSFNLATNLVGGGIGRAAVHPAIPEVELGSFAGPKSITAPREALYDAFRMKAHNARPEAIWDRAGWFELPDKNWAYEISDDLMRLRDNPANLSGFLGPTRYGKGRVEHGPMFEAYPDMTNVVVHREGESGGWSREPSRYDAGAVTIPRQGSPNTDPHFTDPTQVLSHELQHQIAAREGWVPGSSPETTQYRMVRALNDEIAAGRGAEVQPLVATLGRINSPEMQEVIYRLYRRDLGEMMANATQRRLDMTPLQRKQRPPWLDFDYGGMQNAIVPRD
jgi:hypothetical protein